MYERKLIFSYEERYTYESKKAKKNVTVLLFILYSIWESPKYKMVCQKSPTSCEFAKKKRGQKSLTIFIYIMF